MDYPLSTHREHLHDKMKMFYQQRHLIDVALMLNNEEIPAHSTILAAYSPTLFVMLIHPTTKNYKNRILLNLDSFSISLQNLRKLVNFMYDGNMKCLLEDSALEDLKRDAYFLGISQIVQYIDQLKQNNQPCTTNKKPAKCDSHTCLAGPGDEQPLQILASHITVPHKGQGTVSHDDPKKENTRKRNYSDTSQAECLLKMEDNSSKKQKLCERSCDTAVTPNEGKLFIKAEVDKHKVETNSQLKEIITEKDPESTGSNTSKRSNNSAIYAVEITDILNSKNSEASVKDDARKTNVHPNENDTQKNISQDILKTAVSISIGHIQDNALGNDITEDSDNNNTLNKEWLENNANNVNSTIDALTPSEINKRDTFSTVTDENPESIIKDEVFTPKSPRITMKSREVDMTEVTEECFEEYDEEQDQKLAQWDEYCVNGEYVCPHCPDEKWKYLDK